MIPGQPNQLVLDARHPGTYQGQCAEFCGLQHAHMRFVVVAQKPADFEAWLDARRGAPPAPAPGSEAEAGRQVFLDQACSGCHRVAGTEAEGTDGPDLTDMGSRASLGAGTAPNDPETLARWVRDAPVAQARGADAADPAERGGDAGPRGLPRQPRSGLGRRDRGRGGPPRRPARGGAPPRKSGWRRPGRTRPG